MAATKLFINVAASNIGASLVRSLTDMTPVAFPQLVVGDGRSYELYFVDGQGSYAPFSGDGSYIPYIAIGLCGYPTGGTGIWTFGANSTAALPYNVSPAALQTAMQALASVGSGNLLVGGVAGKYYTFTFAGTLANAPQAEITANFSQLSPASTISITTITPGTVSPPVSAVQLAALALNPVTFADDWTPITNGWTGSLSARTVEILEAFAAAGGTLSELFQVTVADADGVRTTYTKVAATIQCTIIDPESFAGADKPLLATQAALNAAVLGLGNFTREDLSSSADGNTNVARPAAACRHHLARIAFTGSGVDRTVSLLTTNSPNPGDFIWVALLPGAANAYRYRIYNATTGGTLLADIQATANQVPYFLAFSWNGSAWELDQNLSIYLPAADNLSGLANVGTAKVNLRTVFSRISGKTADFAILAADEGTLFRANASGGPIVATLPDATSVPAGFLVSVQKLDSGPQVVTTSPATKTLAGPGATILLQSDGNDWAVVLAYDPANVSPTLAQVVSNHYDVTDLTIFRAQATIAGAVATNAAWFIPAGTGGIWILQDNADADNGIDIIRPDDFDVTANPRTWHLLMRGTPPSLAEGDLLYFNGTDLVRLPVGTPGQVLVVDAGGTAPEWQDDAPPAPPVVSKQEVTLDDSGGVDVTPATPVTTVVATVSGAEGARTEQIRLFPPTDPADGSILKLKVEMPSEAGILIEIYDDDQGAVLFTLSSDDGGGSAVKTFAEFVYDPDLPGWTPNFVVSPTPY